MKRRIHKLSIGAVILLLLTTVSFDAVQAQQDAIFTQYQFNKLALNPAYAGARGALSGTAIYRDQWTNIEGSPSTAYLGFHSPIAGGPVNLGVQVINDRIGLINETGIWGSFAYRFPAGRGALALGINGGVSNYRTTLGSTFIVDANDPVFMADQNLFLPNVGFGVYYHSEKFYIGASAPQLIDNELVESSAASSGAQSARRFRHYYAMTGALLPLSSSVKVRPSVLLRYVENAPWQVEGNLSFLLADKVWIGGGYRSLGSAQFNLEYYVTEVFRLGYSYDMVTNELGGQTGGTHEFMVGFDLPGGISAPPVSNPRNFVNRNF